LSPWWAGAWYWDWVWGTAADFSALFPDGQPSTFLPLPTPTREADSFEARLGVFAHSIGATEAGGVDANVELLLPRLPNDLPEIPGAPATIWGHD
jgi:hypothetical protein